eukprot:tig00021612_g22886.t1
MAFALAVNVFSGSASSRLSSSFAGCSISPSTPVQRTPAERRRTFEAARCEAFVESSHETAGRFVAAACAALVLGFGGVPAALAAPAKTPCEEIEKTTYDSGLANAERDKVLNFSGCDFSNRNLDGAALGGVLFEGTNFSGSTLTNVKMTKSNASKANFEGATMTTAIVDRVNFSGANLKQVDFSNSVLAGSVFDGADITGALFEDSTIDSQNFKRLCAIASGTNNKTGIATRDSIGCP